MSPPIQHKLFVMEESQLTALANNARFLKEFPFLKSVRLATPAVHRGCSKCGHTNRQRASVYQAVKQTIANLSQPKKLQLKQMLNAKHIRVMYTRADKKVVELTF